MPGQEPRSESPEGLTHLPHEGRAYFLRHVPAHLGENLADQMGA